MEGINLEFKFKGSRNYVHGTDMISAIFSKLSMNGFSEINNFNISFHKIVRTNLTLNFYETKENIPITECGAILRFQSSKGEIIAALLENGSKISNRYLYNEEKITIDSKIYSDTITLKRAFNLEYSNIEKVVALNKYYLSSHFSKFSGKWLFTKIELKKDISALAPESIELKLVKNIGVKLTKSVILFDKENVGTIYFSMI